MCIAIGMVVYLVWTGKAQQLYDMMKLCGRTPGGIVPCPLHQLSPDPFAGLAADGLPVCKATVLVKGKERTQMAKDSDDRKMNTLVECMLHDAFPSAGLVGRLEILWPGPPPPRMAWWVSAMKFLCRITNSILVLRFA